MNPKTEIGLLWLRRPVAKGKGDASSLVGQPPASGGWEKCAAGGVFTLR
jgi:hypothetical protein